MGLVDLVCCFRLLIVSVIDSTYIYVSPSNWANQWLAERRKPAPQPTPRKKKMIFQILWSWKWPWKVWVYYFSDFWSWKWPWKVWFFIFQILWSWKWPWKVWVRCCSPGSEWRHRRAQSRWQGHDLPKVTSLNQIQIQIDHKYNKYITNTNITTQRYNSTGSICVGKAMTYHLPRLPL